jgi:hypothetical protein
MDSSFLVTKSDYTLFTQSDIILHNESGLPIFDTALNGNIDPIAISYGNNFMVYFVYPKDEGPSSNDYFLDTLFFDTENNIDSISHGGGGGGTPFNRKYIYSYTENDNNLYSPTLTFALYNFDYEDMLFSKKLIATKTIVDDYNTVTYTYTYTFDEQKRVTKIIQKHNEFLVAESDFKYE